MKSPRFHSVIALVLIAMLIASCAGSSRMGGTSKRCGCGTNKGLVGY